MNITEIQLETVKLLSLPFVSGVFPVPVEKIVEYLEFECHLFEPNINTIDIAGAVNHKTKKILINSGDSPQRQLFTLAHEVGHIILHGTNQDYVDYRGKSLGPKETEANHFAANLLMPEEIFRFQWKKCAKNFNVLSHFFAVSNSAVGVRADSLGLD